MFQHTSVDRDEVFKLLQSINGCLANHEEKPLSDERLNRNFERCWPELESKLQEATELPIQNPAPARSSDEMLQEALELLRVQGGEISALRKVVEVAQGRPKASRDFSPISKQSNVLSPPFATTKPEDSSPSDSDPFSENNPAQLHHKPRRIHNFDDLVELWPAVIMRIRKKIGVAAAAYLHDAQPLALTEDEIILGFTKEFHCAKATEATKRLPFEEKINEVMDSPRRLRFQMIEDSSPFEDE